MSAVGSVVATRCKRLRPPKRVKRTFETFLRATLTTTLFPWSQAQINSKHGWRHLKHRHRLVRVPLITFLYRPHAKANTTYTQPQAFRPTVICYFRTCTCKASYVGRKWGTTMRRSAGAMTGAHDSRGW
jgi:hypothetical protein